MTEGASVSRVVEAAKLAAGEVQLKMMERLDEKLSELRKGIRDDIKELRSEYRDEILTCQKTQEQRRRWGIGSLIQSIGIILAFGVGVAALLG